VALLASDPGKQLLSAPPPLRALSFLSRNNWKVVLTVKSLIAGDLRLSSDLQPTQTVIEHPVPSSILDPQHLLALALVWAGGHSLLLFGSPGEGKTFSREWFVALAPDLSQDQERFRLSVTGCLSNSVRSDVFVPAVTDSVQKWVDPRTGWLRLSTHGGIWLDELPLVSSAVRTRFRAWIEGTDAYSQDLLSQGWQASFVSTMNPCPCGFWGESRCVCRRTQVQQVLQKVSWPLLDRFALQYRVECQDDPTSTVVERKALLESMRAQIMLARTRQMERNQKLNTQATLFELPHDSLRKHLVWRQRVGVWSTRRQVQYLQVVQTLLDGEWAKTLQEACGMAWRLCQGTESFRTV
jgi:magnesium chelatase family protein